MYTLEALAEGPSNVYDLPSSKQDAAVGRGGKISTSGRKTCEEAFTHVISIDFQIFLVFAGLESWMRIGISTSFHSR